MAASDIGDEGDRGEGGEGSDEDDAAAFATWREMVTDHAQR